MNQLAQQTVSRDGAAVRVCGVYRAVYGRLGAVVEVDPAVRLQCLHAPSCTAALSTCTALHCTALPLLWPREGERARILHPLCSWFKPHLVKEENNITTFFLIILF